MRRRLLRAIGGVAAASLLLLALPLAVAVRRAYRDEAVLRLQRDATAAGREVDLRTARSGDPLELSQVGNGMAAYDGSGRRLGGAGPDRADGVVRATLRSARPADTWQDGRLVVAVPLLAGERVAGVVRAVRSAGHVDARIRRAWLALGGIAAAVAALAVGAAALVSRRLSAPLERVAVAASTLGEGDFSTRAPPAGVPEVDRVAAALNRTAERLDRMIARERAFAADASHQLRTPLTALRLELEAAALRPDAHPGLLAALDQVDRLEQTVATLLAVARDAPRDPAPLDVAYLLEDVREAWHGSLAARGRPLRIVHRGPLPQADAAAPVVRQVIEVLVDNAARHGAGAVTVTARDAGGALAVDVADEGAGVVGDPEAIFRRRTGTGHGIGLALARSLAAAEGGRLVLSRASPAPVFTLLLAADSAPGA